MLFLWGTPCWDMFAKCWVNSDSAPKSQSFPRSVTFSINIHIYFREHCGDIKSVRVERKTAKIRETENEEKAKAKRNENQLRPFWDILLPHKSWVMTNIETEKKKHDIKPNQTKLIFSTTSCQVFEAFQQVHSSSFGLYSVASYIAYSGNFVVYPIRQRWMCMYKAHECAHCETWTWTTHALYTYLSIYI